MPDDVMDQQDDTQQAAQDPAPGTPDPADQFKALLGLLAQARSQPVPVQQSPLPQVLGPATGTPSNRPKTLGDFLPQAAPSAPASTSPDHPDNASTADVALHGAAQR